MGKNKIKTLFFSNTLTTIAFILLFLIIFGAVFAPSLATHDPERIVLSRDMNKQPPSAEHLLGTDDLGRDIWSRILFGARVSLTVGFLTMFLSVIIGSLYGAVSGFLGGFADNLMMRLVDVLLSLPTIFLLIILAALIKPNAYGIALIIGLTSWMRVARLVRGQFLSLKEYEFIEAARALGFSSARIIFKHILPNVKGLIIVNATLIMASAILIESTLSFLGLGVQPPQFSWGSMLSSAQDLIMLRQAPWVIFFPGFFIFLTALSFNFFGDGLRDTLDPRFKGGGRSV